MSPARNEPGPSTPRYSQQHQQYSHTSLAPVMYNAHFPPLLHCQASPRTLQLSHNDLQDPPPGPARTVPPTHTQLPPQTATAATLDTEESNDPSAQIPPHDWESVNRTKKRRSKLDPPNKDAAQATPVPLSNKFDTLNQLPDPNPEETTLPPQPPTPNTPYLHIRSS